MFYQPERFVYIQIYRWSNYHQLREFWGKYPQYLSNWAGTRKENQINKNANFLDLNIKTQNSIL